MKLAKEKLEKVFTELLGNDRMSSLLHQKLDIYI